jgi:hypothetical protein
VTLHWAHVAAGYALVLGSFAALGLGAALRHRGARRRLALLEARSGGAARRGGREGP